MTKEEDRDAQPLTIIENLAAWLIVGGCFVLFIVLILAVIAYNLIEEIP